MSLCSRRLNIKEDWEVDVHKAPSKLENSRINNGIFNAGLHTHKHDYEIREIDKNINSSANIIKKKYRHKMDI